MGKKNKFPKKVLVIQSTDLGDDPVLLCAETPEEIGEEYEGETVGVYELVTTGKFSVEKSIDGAPPKKK